MVSGMRTWWSDNVAGPQQDYRTSGGRVAKGAAIGAGAGAVAGGTAAGVNAAMDKPYVDYVSETVPRAETGPKAADVFGTDHARLLQAVQSRSDGSASAARSLQHLAYLKTLSPDTPADVLSSLFNTVENHFPKDEQARAAMNLVAACMDKKPGSSPYGVFAEFLNDYHRAGDFDRAQQSFMNRCSLTQDDLQDTVLKMELRHTTLMGRFGVAGAVVIGAGAGAVAGAGAGALVGVLWNAIAKD